jgi:hypothetical protein
MITRCKHQDPASGRRCTKQRELYSLYCPEHKPGDALPIGRPREREASKFNVKLDLNVSRVFDYWHKAGQGSSVHDLMCRALGAWAEANPIPEPDPTQPNLPGVK